MELLLSFWEGVSLCLFLPALENILSQGALGPLLLASLG